MLPVIVSLRFDSKIVSRWLNPYKLHISLSTVKWNITNILAKFDVRSSKQLIALLAAQPPDELRRLTIIE